MKLSNDELLSILDFFDIPSVEKVSRLAGEVDLNFLVKCIDHSKYLLKICRPDVEVDEVKFQVEILNFLKSKPLSFRTPEVILNKVGNPFMDHENIPGHIIRLHTWLDGDMLAKVNPRTDKLLRSWGESIGQLSNALQGFDHIGAHRFDKWNPTEVLFSKKYDEYITGNSKKRIASKMWSLFDDEFFIKTNQLRHSVNYSDAHEHNLIVDSGTHNVMGIIDFGDAIYSATICELAIACAYAGMHKPDPLKAMREVVIGYNKRFPLEEREIEVLYPLICARLMITVCNAAYNLHVESQNEYLQISAKPAWDLLSILENVCPRFAHYLFRDACCFVPFPKGDKIVEWIDSNKNSFVEPVSLENEKVISIDLSVGSQQLGSNSEFETIQNFEKKIRRILEDNEANIAIGGYGEVRPFYTTDAYQREGNNGPSWRTMHIGTDYWMKASSEVYSVYPGVVYSITDNDQPCDYGPTIIIEHLGVDDLPFYTLYGHLSKSSLCYVKEGQQVGMGEMIGYLGDSSENGGWPPHLHFQVILDLLDIEGDFPGVCYVDEASVWLSLCPMIWDFAKAKDALTIESILETRQKNLGKSLSVSYSTPLHVVRGYGQYLYDNEGRRYLDTVNNVAHVGHEHPLVVEEIIKQVPLLNTNTRYLNQNILNYSEKLLSQCPDGLDVVYFVNSGSEANELALRMAKTYSKQKDIVALEIGYHGNTGACIDVSSYKFDGKGGSGAPEYTSLMKMPDIYRGEFKDPKTAGKQYADEIFTIIERLKSKGRNVAGFIAESIMSCGGQIVLPENFLKEVYKAVRNEGGLCISEMDILWEL